MKSILAPGKGVSSLLTMAIILSVSLLTAPVRQAAAARPDPGQVFSDLIRPYRGLNDYTVKIRAKVDMPNIRVPDFTATIYFKKPDRFHVETRRFAPIPRNSGVFNPFQFDPQKNRIQFLRIETLEGAPTDLYRVEPLDPKSPIRYYQVWVGRNPKGILQVESVSLRGTQGIVKVKHQLVRQSDGEWLLPAKVHVHLTFPEGVQSSESQTTSHSPITGGMRQLDEMSGEGDVTITYSEWRVNSGLDESLFKP